MNQFTASLWGDEGFSAILSMKSIPQIIEIIMRDTSPPLYNITEHLAFQLFGTSEIVIRGLSFFYYLLAIFFVFLITKHITKNILTSFIAASLSFLNPFFFIYAFEGRMYSIMAFGVAASMYFFLKIQEKNAKKIDFIGYIFFSLWALYSHHFAIFSIILQSLWALTILVKNKIIGLKIIIALVGVAIGYLPWLLPLYLQTKMVAGGFWLSTPNLKDLRNLIYEYLAQGQKHELDKYALYVIFLLLILKKWTKNIKINLFLILWFLFPIFAAYLISQFFTSVFYNRYLLYSIPASMILISTNRRKYISGILIAILLGLFIKIDFEYFYTPQKRPFRELARYVQENKKGDDFIIIWDAGNHQLWESKYYQIAAPIYSPNPNNLPFFVGTALMENSDIINELPSKKQRIGIITIGEVENVNLRDYPNKEAIDFGKGLKFVWLSK